jgi:hypothetical protein
MRNLVVLLIHLIFSALAEPAVIVGFEPLLDRMDRKSNPSQF